MGNLFTVPAINVGPINQPSPTPTATPAATPTIQVLTCPSDFVREDAGMCRALCDSQYAYSNLYCRHNQESTIRYYAYRARPDQPSEITNARTKTQLALQRANAQLESLRLTRENQASRRSEVAAAGAAAGSLSAGRRLMTNQQIQFNESARLVRDTKNSLRIRRPPVQPETEIPKEQRRIQEIVQKNALFIQIVLFLVFASAVSYMILPMETANYFALGLLSVALMYRIFFVN